MIAWILSWLNSEQYKHLIRVLFSHNVLNGAACAMGMFLVTSFMRTFFGAEASTVATVGVITVLVTDMVSPRRGKLAYIIVSALLGVPLFWAVQRLLGHPLELGLFLVPTTLVVFLGMAWGKRGGPVAIGVMLAITFAISMSPPPSAFEALLRTIWCGMGALLYVGYALLAQLTLNGRYRVQLMADLLLTVAALLRAQAHRISPEIGAPDAAASDAQSVTLGVGELLRRQAALADQLQSTRDVVLESPRTRERQRLAGMLMVVLEMRDHLVASELDLDRVPKSSLGSDALRQLVVTYHCMADDVTQLADDLLWGRKPAVANDHAALLASLHAAVMEEKPGCAEAMAAEIFLRGVAYRLQHQNSAVRQLSLLARYEAEPDLAVVRTSWRLFVSPTDWSLQPFLTLWHWRQPALRHAIRAALAVGTGYTIAVLQPWSSHQYWIVLTIVVVLRGSLAQTLERRNQRVAGTLLGSLLATVFLSFQPSELWMVLIVTVAQGLAHGFILRRYTITAMCASIMGLIQAHMLYAGQSTTFAFVERVADTLLGAAIAWGFSYVLPSWERGQLGSVLQRVLRALRQHTRLSLGLTHMDDIGTEDELLWRLARREVYDALSALILATDRALVEPRAVRPPLVLLERLQGHSYQLLGQLSAIKSVILLRRQQLSLETVAEPVRVTSAHIQNSLTISGSAVDTTLPTETPAGTAFIGAHLPAVPESLPDPFVEDVSPWVLRRLHLSVDLAQNVRSNALQVLSEVAAASNEPPPNTDRESVQSGAG